MKRILMLALILSSVRVMGQAPAFKPYQPPSLSLPQKARQADSTLKVSYIDDFKELHSGKEIALFLNGKHVDTSVWSSLPRSFIDSIYVINESIDIGGVSYFRQYFFRTKTDYNPKLVSLNDLKDRYVKLKIKSPIFMLDGNIIDADYDKYMVDENYILHIVVETMRHVKKNSDVGFIKLSTRSPENIKKSKEIRIRGSAVSMNK